MISAERLRELLSYDLDTGVFIWRHRRRGIRVGDVAGYKDRLGYINITIEYRRYFAHRLSWFYVYGYWPPAEITETTTEVIIESRIYASPQVLRTARTASAHATTSVVLRVCTGCGAVGVGKPRSRYKARRSGLVTSAPSMKQQQPIRRLRSAITANSLMLIVGNQVPGLR